MWLHGSFCVIISIWRGGKRGPERLFNLSEITQPLAEQRFAPGLAISKARALHLLPHSPRPTPSPPRGHLCSLLPCGSLAIPSGQIVTQRSPAPCFRHRALGDAGVEGGCACVQPNPFLPPKAGKGHQPANSGNLTRFGKKCTLLKNMHIMIVI